MLALATITLSCSKDDDEESKVVNYNVVINENGKTSNGSIFTAVDDKNFYLDYIKYTIKEEHMVVSDHDKSCLKGEAKIASRITYKGKSYDVLEIGKKAFRGCIALTSITIPSIVTFIDSEAFCNCSGLTSIKVDAGNTIYDSRNDCNAIIETITNTLIKGCHNTVIPNSVTSIGSYAFDACSGMTSVTIPNSVTTIGYSAFSYCSDMTSVTIPNSVTSIGSKAFWYCIGLTSITIPNSVTSISEHAFEGCSGLTSVSIPNSVTSIGISAFCGCTGLTSFTIPNSVTSIEDFAFRECTGLTSFTIPNSVTSIENGAFYQCSGLTSIHCLSTTPPSIKSPFEYSTYTMVTLYVPKGSLDAYKKHDRWRLFKNIVEE